MILAVDSVSKAFAGREVLKAASFWAREGRITTIMGRNGSGKTTLFRIAVGEVWARGGVVRYLSKAYEYPRLPVLARRGLYYMEENSRLPSTFRIETYLSLIATKYRRQSMDEVVASLALEKLLQQKFHQLSGGEARRVSLAGAVIRGPRCLLIDEPFHGLTPNYQAVVARALRDLAAEGTAIVATGHEVSSLLGVADEVIWCVAGTTHGLGRPEEARGHRQFVREYLGWHSGASIGESRQPPSGQPRASESER